VRGTLAGPQSCGSTGDGRHDEAQNRKTTMAATHSLPAEASREPRICLLGLSPAWQQIALLEQLSVGQVQRATEWFACASGKVLNVSLALQAVAKASADGRAVGPSPAAVTIHTVTLAGGLTGEQLRAEFTRAGGQAEFVPTAAATRTCTTLLERDSGRATEIVENAPPLEAAALGNFHRVVAPLVAAADVLVLAGSFPRGVPVETNLAWARACPGRVVVDAQGPLLLATLPARPYLLKPNREELARTLGRPLDTDAALLAGLDELHARGATWLVVSHGAEAVWVSGPNHRSRWWPPSVRVVNPIGSGDCLAAGLAWGLAGGREPPEAIAWAIAAAADNATRLLPARIDVSRVRELVPQVRGEVLTR